jgi:hypothetical protein
LAREKAIVAQKNSLGGAGVPSRVTKGTRVCRPITTVAAVAKTKPRDRARKRIGRSPRTRRAAITVDGITTNMAIDAKRLAAVASTARRSPEVAD